MEDHTLKPIGLRSPDAEPITHRKPHVDPSTLHHRQLLDGPFWQRIPAYRGIDEATFYDDVAEGFKRAPMSIRVSPYLLSLIEWVDPYNDPLRRQFVPVASRLLPDHPKLTLDSLHEQADAPVPGLTHRYPDKALFLALDTCPVYCRFCTRSYAVGVDTENVEKVSLKATEDRWERAFRYISERPELEDIVVSGGDSYQLKARQITLIGNKLLELPNIRRIRFATKGPAVMPMKLITDHEWLDALTAVVERGRKLHKEVVLHTHFNHPNEITAITKRALDGVFERGIITRNQSVLQRNVNDTVGAMQLLVKRLGHCQVHPYYVYVHDLVKGVEDLRTTLQTALDLEKAVRGVTAGFHTPTFVVDAPGGGGKRFAHTSEHYDRETGISVFAAPSVKPGFFLYFDPVDTLSPEIQAKWADERERERMIEAAIAQAKLDRAANARASSIR
jgi:lysine 2,3-aminomutase